MTTHVDDHRWLNKSGFKVGYLNVCHLLNKTSDIPTILSNHNNSFHCFGFSESRLQDVVSDELINVPEYSLIRKDAKGKLETGLVVYVHHSVNFKQVNIFDKYHIECIWIEIRLKGSKPMLIGFLYRNPDERANWFERFELLMEDAHTFYTEIILLGDFNIDLIRPQEKWKRIINSFHLTQMVTTPTRITLNSATLIDHIYVNSPANIAEISVPSYGLSDHFPVCITWCKKGTKIPTCGHKSISFRNYKNFSVENFLSDLSMADFQNVYQCTDPDKALETWHNIFVSVYDKHAPTITKRVRRTHKPPWLNEEIKKAIVTRDYILKTVGRGDEFNKHRNKVTALKRAAKKKYFGEMISSKKDTKSIWKAIRGLSGKTPHPVAPLTTEISTDTLNKHFSTIAEEIIKADRSEYNDLLLLKQFCDSKLMRSNLQISYISIHEVYKELSSIKQSSSRGLDGLDSKILKISAHIISEHITYIYNLCIEKKCFPQTFKDAKVIPHFKSGDRSDPGNYRPISILPALSKPLERYLKQNIQAHFKRYNLLHPNQSGFREKHSCHSMLTNLVEQWHHNINEDLVTGTIFVDFAKAFDVINHKLLIKKLMIYGFSSDALDLITSFLSNRRQKVFIDSQLSSYLPINFGVPQGSVLGPTLFSIYINDLPLHITSTTELFADDTTLHTNDKDANNVCTKLQKDIDNLVEWTELNHMALHPQKSKFMLITTRQKRQNIKSKLKELRVRDRALEEVDSYKILGLIVDNNLSWSTHISTLCKKMSKKIFQLNRIKHFLDQHSRRLFFHAYLLPDIDYASTCWDLASQNCLRHLSSIYRRSLKLILLKSTIHNSDYKELNILPLNLKCRFNKGVFMYKIMNGLAPSYLVDKFPSIQVRSKTKIFIPRPRTDLFMSSFTFSGSKLWNEMPCHLKSFSSLFSFKKAYSKFLMDSFTNVK